MAALAPLFEEVFGEAVPLTPDLSAEDVEGWDSTRMIELVIAVEARFALKLTTREVDGLATVGDLAALVARKAAR
ncbi:acyl carrier protein [Methylobacterium terrae]|uniref:Acyl carrier protein n=1 Tax=Methylobacterium terrae TaxID=2202827 RepID=A0A2U8WNW5_9HYPH|nr:acyl carrier protein [Methylobacterium terrae]AWN47006.1 acyl carrier protein [Methylobacterium terrae]